MQSVRFDRPSRFKMLAGDRHRIDQEVARLAEAFDTNVSFSHLCRALMLVLEHVEPELERLAKSERFPRRPPHDAPDSIRRYDRRWANLILRAAKRRSLIPD